MSSEVFREGGTTKYVPEMRPKSASEKSVQMVCPRGVVVEMCVPKVRRGVSRGAFHVFPNCAPRSKMYLMCVTPNVLPVVCIHSGVCCLRCALIQVCVAPSVCVVTGVSQVFKKVPQTHAKCAQKWPMCVNAPSVQVFGLCCVQGMCRVCPVYLSRMCVRSTQSV